MALLSNSQQQKYTQFQIQKITHYLHNSPTFSLHWFTILQGGMNLPAVMESFSSIDTQAKNSHFNPQPENHLDRARRRSDRSRWTVLRQRLLHQPDCCSSFHGPNGGCPTWKFGHLCQRQRDVDPKFRCDLRFQNQRAGYEDKCQDRRSSRGGTKPGTTR